MRERIMLILLIALGLAVPAGAQVSFVTMTGTNTNYANGTMTANFLAPAGSAQLPYLQLHFPFTVTAPLNSSGVWSMSLADNSTMSPAPAGSQWRLQLCSAGTFGAPTCYSVIQTVTCVNNVSCSGSTLDLSSTFAAAPVPPSGGGGIGTNNNFVFVGDSITGGLHSSTGSLACGTTVPSAGYAAKTTGSGLGGVANTMTVANATGIAVGQYVVQAASLTPGVLLGSLVTNISGTTITLSNQNIQAFTNQTFTFVNADPVSVAMSLPNFTGHGAGFSCGVPGWTSGLLVGDYGGRIHPISPIVTGTPGFFFVMIGINDINVSNLSAATIEANLATEWQFAKQDGFTVIAQTILPAPFTAAQAVVWQQVNAWIRAQTGRWDRLVDMANIMPNNLDTNLYFTDNEHPTNGGFGLIAQALSHAVGSQASTLSSPQSVSTTASCLAAPTVTTPCLAYAGTFTGLGASGTTGVQTLYTSNAPAGAAFQFCPFVFQSTAGTAGSIQMQVTYTTPSGQNRIAQGIGGSPPMTGTGLLFSSCNTVVVQANSTLSFAVLAVGGTGTPVWETEPIVTRLQ